MKSIIAYQIILEPYHKIVLSKKNLNLVINELLMETKGLILNRGVNVRNENWHLQESTFGFYFLKKN